MSGCNKGGFTNPEACQGFSASYLYPLSNNTIKNACGLKHGWLGEKTTFTTGYRTPHWYNATVVDNYCKAVFGPNYSVNKGEHGIWGFPNGNASMGMCQMNEPAEKDKHACCTMDKSQLDTGACSANGWCAGQQVCKDYITSWCKQGTNALLNDDCFNNYKNDAGIAALCSTQEHFRNPRCKTFCDAQVGSNTAFAAGCKAAAGTYCAANPSAAECTCINFRNTPQYAELLAKYPTLSAEPYQCWATPCTQSSTPSWPENLASETKACRPQLKICNQDIDLSKASISSVGSLTQICGDESPVPGTTKPAPGSPVTTTPGTTTPAPGSPSFFSKYKYFIGGGVLLFLLLCCLVVILIAFM